jgi:hypothetical protein
MSSSDSVLAMDWPILDLPFKIWEGQGFFSSLLPDMLPIPTALIYVTQLHNFWCSQKNLIYIHMQTCTLLYLSMQWTFIMTLFTPFIWCTVSKHTIFSPTKCTPLFSDILLYNIFKPTQHVLITHSYRYCNTEYLHTIRVHFLRPSIMWFHYDVAAFMSCLLCLHADTLTGATERLSLECWNQETNVTHSSNSPPSPYTWLSITRLLII